MLIHFAEVAIIFTFIGLFLLVWTPVVESKGGGTGYKPSKTDYGSREDAWKKQQERGTGHSAGSSSSGTGSYSGSSGKILRSIARKVLNVIISIFHCSIQTSKLFF